MFASNCRPRKTCRDRSSSAFNPAARLRKLVFNLEKPSSASIVARRRALPMSKRPSPMSRRDRTRWCWYGVTAAVPSACFTQAAAPRASPQPTRRARSNSVPFLHWMQQDSRSQFGPPRVVNLAYHASDETGGRYGSLHQVRRRITRHGSVLPKMWSTARRAPNEPRLSAAYATLPAGHGWPLRERCRHVELCSRMADRHHLLPDRQATLRALPCRSIHRDLWRAEYHPQGGGNNVRTWLGVRWIQPVRRHRPLRRLWFWDNAAEPNRTCDVRPICLLYTSPSPRDGL